MINYKRHKQEKVSVYFSTQKLPVGLRVPLIKLPDFTLSKDHRHEIHLICCRVEGQLPHRSLDTVTCLFEIIIVIPVTQASVKQFTDTKHKFGVSTL